LLLTNQAEAVPAAVCPLKNSKPRGSLFLQGWEDRFRIGWAGKPAFYFVFKSKLSGKKPKIRIAFLFLYAK